MRDMVAACGAGHLEATPLLDLNHTETSAGGLEVCVALHPALDRVVLLQARAWMWFDLRLQGVDMTFAGHIVGGLQVCAALHPSLICAMLLQVLAKLGDTGALQISAPVQRKYSRNRSFCRQQQRPLRL